MIEYTVRVWPDGRKEWWLNGQCHRDDGPAIESSDGYKYWYLNGERHRTDGPAAEWPDGYKAWYLNGKRLTEEEWKKKVGKPTEKAKLAKCLKQLLECLEEE